MCLCFVSNGYKPYQTIPFMATRLICSRSVVGTMPTISHPIDVYLTFEVSLIKPARPIVYGEDGDDDDTNSTRGTKSATIIANL